MGDGLRERIAPGPAKNQRALCHNPDEGGPHQGVGQNR